MIHGDCWSLGHVISLSMPRSVSLTKLSIGVTQPSVSHHKSSNQPLSTINKPSKNNQLPTSSISSASSNQPLSTVKSSINEPPLFTPLSSSWLLPKPLQPQPSLALLPRVKSVTPGQSGGSKQIMWVALATNQWLITMDGG